MPRTQRLGIAVLIAATALWAQLAAVPAWITARSDGGILHAPTIVFGILVPVLAFFGVRVAEKRPDLGVAIVLAGVPIALGIFAWATPGHAPPVRYDAPARWIAGVTALTFTGLAVTWAGALTPRITATTAPMSANEGTSPPPPLRAIATIVLTVLAVVIVLILPPLATGHGALTRQERLGGESLFRARESLVAIGSLIIATVVVLGAGSTLVRGRSTPRRRPARAAAFLIWGVAFAVLWWLLHYRAR